jgi:putative transposase
MELLQDQPRSGGGDLRYGAISVSPTAIKAVTQYIEHKREHHARRPFEEEYIAMLERAGVKYDPEYVLD